ncbi:hypothetical protein EYR36_001828 [Pleurotus pulmonarius]|nr:hypothetical protein EYR36_008231 [Pleurotus pulmonarius]KAF4580008.1 hypothetical protein EYR36_001828 [Pleurotus pulmonarius]
MSVWPPGNRHLPGWIRWEEEPIRRGVLTAMMKSMSTNDEVPFISAEILTDELEPYFRPIYLPRRLPMIAYWNDYMLPSIHSLIDPNRTQLPRPSHEDIKERITMLGQYAILSHCWDQDNSQELTFDDILDLSDARIRAKRGFTKLQGFAKTIQSYYGCRYLWMDTACIKESDRTRSIPLMFDWYHNASICIVQLSATTISGDRWWTRGWTLQEWRAAPRIVYLTSNWDLLIAEGLSPTTERPVLADVGTCIAKPSPKNM